MDVIPGIKLEMMAALDFERLKEDYDCIHLTGKGEAETRFPWMGLGSGKQDYKSASLCGWDCESTCWLTFPFDKIEYIGGKKSFKSVRELVKASE